MKRSRTLFAAAFVLALGAGGVAAAQTFVPGGGLLARWHARSQAFAAALALDASQQAAWHAVQVAASCWPWPAGAKPGRD